MADFVSIFGSGLTWAGFVALPLLFILPLITLIFPKSAGAAIAILTKALDIVSGAMMAVAVVAAFGIVLIQLAAVLLRYVFGVSFSWLNDSVIFSFAMIFMLGAAATLRDDGHVRVDILRPRFSPRTRAIIELIGVLLFIFPIGILILYAGSGLINRSWVGLEPFNESDGLPIKFLFKTLVPLFAILMISQGLSQALKAALALRGQRPFDDEPSHLEGAA